MGRLTRKLSLPLRQKIEWKRGKTLEPELDDGPEVFDPLVFLCGPPFFTDAVLEGAGVESWKETNIKKISNYTALISSPL